MFERGRTHRVAEDTSQDMKGRFLGGAVVGALLGVAFGLYLDKQVYRRQRPETPRCCEPPRNSPAQGR